MSGLMRLGLALFAFSCFGIESLWAADADGRRWALLIGVNDYANLDKLSHCLADVRALRNELIASGFESDRIKLITDDATEARYRPSKGNIEKQLDLVLGQARTNDLVLIAFSGHGVYYENDSYLCPPEADTDDPLATMVSQQSVNDKLLRSHASLRLVFIDACRDLTVRGKKSAARLMEAGNMQKALDRVPESVLLFNSCSPGQIAHEHRDLGHGVFMNFLLSGLQGQADTNRDGQVTVGELWDYSSDKTQLYADRHFNALQVPRLGGELTRAAQQYPLRSATASARVSVASPPPSKPMDFNGIPSLRARKTLRAARSPNMVTDSTLPTSSNGSFSSDKPGTTITNSLGMKLTLIPAGSFQMGSYSSIDAVPIHTVRLSRPFYLGVHEVTQGAWQDLMGTTPWSGEEDVRVGRDYPATCVSYDDALEFCRKLTAIERGTNGLSMGEEYRLPTEAEWEYACRAGTSKMYSFGDDESRFGDYAWYGGCPENPFTSKTGDGNAKNERYAHRVGLKQPNGWGLFDMHGNVWEWCLDWYDGEYYSRAPQADPMNTQSGDHRVLRGGGWGSIPELCRSAARMYGASYKRRDDYGFRLVRGQAAGW